MGLATSVDDVLAVQQLGAAPATVAASVRGLAAVGGAAAVVAVVLFAVAGFLEFPERLEHRVDVVVALVAGVEAVQDVLLLPEIRS